MTRGAVSVLALVVIAVPGRSQASSAFDDFGSDLAAGGAMGCLTPALHALHARWGELSLDERHAAAGATDPFYPGWLADGGLSWREGDVDAARQASRASCFHPTELGGFEDFEGVGGSDRVALFRRSGSAPEPALIEEVLGAFDRALDAFAAQGWRPPAGLPTLPLAVLLDTLPGGVGGYSWWAPCAAAFEGRVDYVVLDLGWLRDDERRAGLIAHETFHGVQRAYAFDEYVTGFAASDSRFWVEATAVYAEGVVVPEAEELPAARSAVWSETPFAPLGAWDDVTSRQYASFVFPLAIEQALGAGDWHRGLWERIDGRSGFTLLDELDAELCARGLSSAEDPCSTGAALDAAFGTYLAHAATMDLPRGDALLSMRDLPAAVGRDGGWAARGTAQDLPMQGAVAAGAAGAPGSRGGSYVLVDLDADALRGRALLVSVEADGALPDGGDPEWAFQLVAAWEGAVVQRRSLTARREGSVQASARATGLAENADVLYLVASPTAAFDGAAPGWSWSIRGAHDAGTELELVDGGGCDCGLAGSRRPEAAPLGLLVLVLGCLRRPRRRPLPRPPSSRPLLVSEARLVHIPFVPRTPLLVLVWMLGCGGPAAPAPASAPPSDGPTAGGAPDPALPAEPPPASLPLTGAAHRFAPAPAGHAYAETIEFLGWSDGGETYAYELRRPAEGASCSARWSLVVVDAAADSLVAGAQRAVAHDSPEGGPQGCSPPSLEPGIEVARTEALALAGIRVGHLVAPNPVLAAPDGALSVMLATGARLTLRFAVAHTSEELYAVMESPGAAYTLSVVPPGGATPVVIEDGQRRRAMVMRYELLGLPVFLSPDGVHAAVFVRTVFPAFEGTRASVMSNGLTLLPSWSGAP